jgi:hypothetical protein
MSVSLTTPVVGATVTGFTSPTFTLTEDSAQKAYAKQWAVTALGGTQPSEVDVHSISNPFTVTVERPANFRGVGQPNPVTGSLGVQPRNVFKVRIRKGMLPLSGQSDQISNCEIRIPIVAGADSADPENIRALFSVLGGVMYGNADSLAQATIDGII